MNVEFAASHLWNTQPVLEAQPVKGSPAGRDYETFRRTPVALCARPGLRWVTAALLALSLVLAFEGCTSRVRAYRTDASISFVQDRIKPNPLCDSNYIFSVIEFDDQGEFWERRQLTDTMDEIEKLKCGGWPVILIVFVHGWKNNAASDCGNLTNFYQFIQNLAQLTLPDKNRPKPKVVGVYLAWRGDVFAYDDPLVNNLFFGLPRQLTLWNRMRAAERVAGVSCTEAILSLAAKARAACPLRMNDPGTNQVNQVPNSCPNYCLTNPPDSQVIIVGHSLGGLIVERAVTQAMLGSMLSTAPERAAKGKDLERLQEALYKLKIQYDQATSQRSNSEYVIKSFEHRYAKPPDLERLWSSYTSATNSLANLPQGKKPSETALKRVASTSNHLARVLTDRSGFENARTNLLVANELLRLLDPQIDTNLLQVARIEGVKKRPADLVLLINPACGAVTAKKMIDALDKNELVGEHGNFIRSSRPWIISVSSKADWATGLLFPLSMRLTLPQYAVRTYGTNQEAMWSGPHPARDRRVPPPPSRKMKEIAETPPKTNASQAGYMLHTAPQYESLISHHFVRDRSTNRIQLKGTNGPVVKSEPGYRQQLLIRNLKLDTNEPPVLVNGQPTTLHKNQIVTLNGTYTLTNVLGALNQSGYWIIQADKHLIGGHDKIFEDDFYAMVAGLFRMSRAYDVFVDTNTGSAEADR